ncbi:OmpA family protein [Sorangium cellulosum]|uniref:OmpA family protein n=1 Tax=Sorangium cellulosum TaxID=56 RepID=UPI0005D179A8|nr:OmpA family protein [Sorangium cellulosum]
MRSSSIAAAASAAVLVTLASAARGQSSGGFSLDRFEPAPAGDAFFGVPSPAAPGHLAPRVYAMVDYAHRPIHSSGDDSIDLVSSQAFLRLDASLALWDRLLLSIDAPLAIAQGGDDPRIAGVEFTELRAPELGDLRFGARVRLLGEDAGPLQLGLGGYLFAPTGTPAQYTGDAEARGALHASLGGRVDLAHGALGFLWNASGGVELGGGPNRPQQLTFGGAAGLLIGGDLLQLGAEAYGAAPLGEELLLSSAPVRPEEAGVNAELLLGAKLRVLGGLTFGAAVGPGLTNAIGTPPVRAVGVIGWTPLPEPAPERAEAAAALGDKDDDGIDDHIDACPDVKGDPSPDPAKDGCPPADRDGDAVLDIDDACPSTPGARSADATQNGCPDDSDDDGFHDGIDACPSVRGGPSDDPKLVGCPSDADGDGIADASDACPKVKGPASQNPKQNGCPDDPDGDGVRGAADACPNERGLSDPDPRQNGCPRFVRVNADEITTSKPVQFVVYGKTRAQTVDPVSDEILYEVRDAIQQNPDIELVEVQGHTDDSGTEEYNQRLSQERAEAVLSWLVAAGVPREKLVARGYGFEQPLGDNRVKTGRQKNRRVQFVIIKRKGRQ